MINTRIKVSNIKIPIDYSENQIKSKIAKALRVSELDVTGFSIVKKSIDARDKSNIFYLYTFIAELKSKKNIADETEEYLYKLPIVSSEKFNTPPVVAGSGPAGLFAALLLAEAGLCPIILERGKDVDERKKDVDAFFSNRILNTDSNVQFGEGGAGTFSDGKLTTNIKDERVRFVLQKFAEFGAPDEILYLSKPHIGTDYLIKVVRNIRHRIQELGGEFRFSTKLCSFEMDKEGICEVLTVNESREIAIQTKHLVLAVGHSARDTFEMLYKRGVVIRPKPFAVGVRIEHPQTIINEAQYGNFAGKLPPADYKLAYKTSVGRGVYTFCMCPGGYVVAAASEEGGVCVNGMSNFSRNAENANSALLVTVTPEDFGASPLSGIAFQRSIEKAAFISGGGNYNAPAQYLGDFLKTPENRKSAMIDSVKKTTPSYKPNVSFTELGNCLPAFITNSIAEALPVWNRKIKGFADKSALMTAPETRSSSPVTILRDEGYEAIGIKGLYPCGEGAGYAGGIVSAAVDGIRCVEKICK